VYRYITSGSHESGAQQNGALEGSPDKSLEARFTELGLEELSPERAPLPLLSLYEKALGEHPNTNVTPGFTGTLDYIFYRPSDSLRFINLLALPAAGAPELEGGLPNYRHPSDHLPIGADFAIH
jgi:mRNA deadenylase 3'-5' endonuclease subunit Ccr4